MNYLIAVLSDRMQAEAAYSALEQEALPMDQISILGKGFEITDEFGFVDPVKKARKQAKFMSYWLVPFGFVGGYGFNLLTGFELFSWAGALGNHIIGGLLGAIGGAMGSFFIGGSAGLLGSSSGDAPPYRKMMDAGKYLVVVSGQPNLTNKANRILRQLKAESVYSYVDPTRA